MLSLRRLRNLILVLVGFTLPFEHTRLDVGSYPLTPNKAVAAILVAFAALQWAVERRRPHPDSKRVWVLFLAVAEFVSLLQGWFTGVPSSTIVEVGLTTFTLILFYFIMTYTMVESRDIDRLMLWFAAGCVVAALTGWLGYGARLEGGRYVERLAGEGANPNLLAFNLLVAIACAVSLLLTSQRLLARSLYLGSIALMTVGVLASLSRTAFLALPAMGCLWAVRFRRVRALSTALPILVVLGAAVYFVPEEVFDRFRDFTSARRIEDLDSSARRRFLMLPAVARAFAQNPITGVGEGGYLYWALAHGEVVAVVHNAYLQVLVENGLLGFVPFMALVFLGWRDLSRAWLLAQRRGRGRDPELRRLELRAVLLQIGYLGALVMGLGQPSNRHKAFWLLFVLSTVLLALVGRRVREVAAAGAPQARPTAVHPAYALGAHRVGPARQ